MVEEFDDQSGCVEEADKAQLMAEEERKERDLATMYNEYIANPDTFEQAHPTIEATQIGFLKKLHKRRVLVSYILRLGELKAEVEGDVYDFRSRVREYSDEALLDLEHALSNARDRYALLIQATGSDYHEGTPDRIADEINEWLQYDADWKKLNAIAEERTGRSRESSNVVFLDPPRKS